MDLKYVARQLLRRPGHTLAVIACLVIGLVASVGTFSVITSLFYGDVPGIAGRRSVARIFLRYDIAPGSESVGDGRFDRAPLSFNDFAIMRELPADSAIEAIGAEGTLRMTAAGSHGPVSISGAFVSGDFFRVLRTTPVRGRLLTPDDDRPAAAPVAVVTDYFWRTQLDGRDDAIGRPVLLGGNPFTVVGVAPARFHGLQILDPGQDDSNGVQAWIPLALAPQWPTGRSLDTVWLRVVGRVKAGLTTTDVERQLTVSAARIAASQPTTRANAAPRVGDPGLPQNDNAFELFTIMIAILALPLIVLAIGCANVANLHLARVAEQSRELAVRLALGATRAQLVRLLTLETLARVLIAVGLSIGLILPLTLDRVQAMVPVFVSIDWRVLIFAVSLALGVSLATGLVPAWIVLRRTAAGELKQGSQSGGLRHSRLRSALIVGQVALSFGLMVLAGLFARTVQTMVNEAPSALRQQMVATFDPSQLRMTPLEARRFADAVAAGAAADGRVTHVSISIDDRVRFGLPGAPQTTDRAASLVAMTAAWVDVMEVRLLTGRRLTDADDHTTAMLSARAAEMIAPGASPLGKVIRVAHRSSAPREVRIVGVVADNPLRQTIEGPDAVIYVPLPKELGGQFTLRVRAADPEALRVDLLTLVNRIDPRIAWTSIRRGDMRFQDNAREVAFVGYAVSAAGTVALALSATGLYALLSYLVALRRREIGVRLAIGAPPARIITLVVRQALKLVLAGMACGLALAVPMAFVMRATFVGKVTATDPMIFLPMISVLLAVGILAAVVPALRASRIDPIDTLRQE